MSEADDSNSRVAYPVGRYRSLLDDVLGLMNSTRLRRLGAQVGSNSLISPTARILLPRKLSVGDSTAIQRRSTFDCRSQHSIGVSIGSNCRFKENVWCAAYGGKITVGNNVLVGRNTVIHGHGDVSIGDWSMMGPGVMILSSEHGHFLNVERTPFQLQPEDVEAVSVGENVWIGAGATLLPGIHVENDVVIGAGSVVTKNLQSGSVYAGVPAERIAEIGHRARHSDPSN